MPKWIFQKISGDQQGVMILLKWFIIILSSAENWKPNFLLYKMAYNDPYKVVYNTVISKYSGTQSFQNAVRHSHFLIWWNTVISQLGGTQSFLNFMEHSHFLIW